MPILLFLFFFGLAVGSFLNVLIDRLFKDESIISPPSRCDHCKKPLAWYDLIPVLSFLLLKGRCRYCKKPIHWQYPVVELSTAILFAAVVAGKGDWGNWGDWGALGYFLFIISALIVIFFADLKYGIIPDRIVFPGIAITATYSLITNYQLLITNHLLSAICAFLFFLAIYLLTRGRGMGFGDVKLVFLLGLFFGFPKIIFTLYIAFLTGAAFSIILILLGKKKLKGTIAFGPFLVIGSIIVMFFGDRLARIVWFLPG